MAQEVIWQGSSSFSTGQTPWGLYDSDSDFSSDVDKFADWCARRLGHPIMSVELNRVLSMLVMKNLLLSTQHK